MRMQETPYAHRSPNVCEVFAILIILIHMDGNINYLSPKFYHTNLNNVP